MFFHTLDYIILGIILILLLCYVRVLEIVF